jgi:hypothetical protein
MIFVAQNVRYDLPVDLADRLAKAWRIPVPREPNVRVIHESFRVTVLDGAGNWFRERETA